MIHTIDDLQEIAHTIRSVQDVDHDVILPSEVFDPVDADTLEHAAKGLELLRWLVHLHCGVGKGGQSPCGSEWDDALEQALEFVGEPKNTTVVKR
jgi:hypothetical protein